MPEDNFGAIMNPKSKKMKNMILLFLCFFMTQCAISQSEWKTDEGKLLQGRAFAGSASLHNKIYIIGGVINPYTDADQNTDIVEEYDPLNKTRIEKNGRMPTARHCFGIATDHHNSIYVAGGADWDGNYRAELEVYHVDTDKWTKLKSMPTPRQQTCAALIGDSLYVIGGDNSAGNPATRYCFEVYVISKNEWVAKPNMPIAARNACAVVFNKKIYVIGGHGEGNKVLEYHPAKGSWAQKANMPTPRTDLAVELLNGKIYAIGGHPGIPAVEEYDPWTDLWKKKENMPAGRCFHSSAVFNHSIYILGGSTLYSDNQRGDFRNIESFMPDALRSRSFEKD